MKYSFKFKLFGKNVGMFSDSGMGIVIEKERQVVCVYGTDEQHKDILCAIPLCHPKFLKGAEYIIEFSPDLRAVVSVGDIKIRIDYKNQKCANNKDIPCYGSAAWGQDVTDNWE